MKAKIKAHIEKMTKDGGNVTLTLFGPGKVETTNISAQEASFSGLFVLKAIAANKIPIGSIITVTISDEEIE